jgi:hypothetical protein
MAAIIVGIGVFMGSSLASAVFAQTISQINGCSNTVCKNIAINTHGNNILQVNHCTGPSACIHKILWAKEMVNTKTE